MGIPLRSFEVALGVHAVMEWPSRQSGQLSRVAVSKWDRHSISSEIRQAGKRIGGKTRLTLLTVGYDGRSRFFQAGNCVAQGSVFGVELLVRHLSRSASTHCRQQLWRPRDASNRFVRYWHVLVAPLDLN